MLTRGDQPPPAAQQQQQQQRPTEQDAGDLYQLVNMLQQSILTEQQRRHTKEDADEMERLKAQGAKGYVEASSLTKELFPGSFPVQDGVYPLLTETLQAEIFTKLLSLGSFEVTSEKVENDKMMEFVIEEKAAPGNFTRTLYHSGAALDDHVAGNIKDEANKLFTVASQATASHRAKLSASINNGSLPPPPPDALARFEAAVKMYTSAMASCQSNDTLAVLLNNRSTCFFNMGRVSASATDANASLMHKPTYWKALQRRGVCLKEMGSRRLAILAEMLNAAAPTTTSSPSPSTTEEKLNADKSVFKQEALRMIEIGESDEAFALANADNSAADFGSNYVFDEVTSLLGTVSQNSIPPQPPLSQKSVHTDAAAENLLLQTVPSSLVLPLPNKKWCGTDASVDLTNINNVITVDRSDAKKGRAVHAKHQLLKGTTVLIETPYAVTPLNNNNSGYGVMTNRATGGNSQSGPNSNQINTGSSYCAMCMKRTDLLYPGPEYRTKALLPTLLPIQAIAKALLEQHASSIVLAANATPADQLLSVYTTVKALIKNVSLLHNGKKVDAATKKITTYVAVKIWEELADAEISSLDISSLVADGSIPAGVVGVKSRGLFCSGACATHSWETYGIYESRNPYFLVCPVDTLLATRVIATNKVANGQRGIALRSNENTTSPLAIDEVADNRFGASHMDSLCAFTREAVPQLAEVGGKESVLAALACHFKVSVQVAGVASSAPFYEQLRKAHRQIVTNAFLLSCQDRVFMTNPSGPAGPSQQQHSLVTANVGKAMYSVASLFNHSCDPNCVVSFNGGPYEASGQLRIKLVRSVQEGEELTIQYGAVDKFRVHSTRGRIRALRAAHGFACACSSCYSEVDEPIKKEDEEYYHKASDYYQKGRRLTREGNFVDAINVLLQSYEIVMRYICPPPRAPQMMVPKTHDALAQAFLALSNGFATSPAGDKETPQAVSKRLREYHHNRAKAIEHLKAALALNLQLHKSITFNEPIPSIGITMGNNNDTAAAAAAAATTSSSSSATTALTTTTPPTTCYPAWLTTHHPTNTTKMMSAAFLTSEHLDIGTNVGIVEEYVRIAFLLAGEVESRVQTKHLASATPETTSVTTNDDAVLATQRDEAILFAKKAIELLVLFYGCGGDADEGSSLGAAEEGQQHSPAGGNSVTSLSSEVLRLEGVVEAMQHVM